MLPVEGGMSMKLIGIHQCLVSMTHLGSLSMKQTIFLIFKLVNKAQQ